MDLSVRRVLEALLPGPAVPGILTVRYGMEMEESVQALARAVDDGLAEPCGPLAYRLTADGRETALSVLPGSRRDRALRVAGGLERRDMLLRRFDC